MQSESGFPSSHQLKSYRYVASKSRLKLAARAVLSADAGFLVSYGGAIFVQSGTDRQTEADRERERDRDRDRERDGVSTRRRGCLMSLLREPWSRGDTHTHTHTLQIALSQIKAPPVCGWCHAPKLRGRLHSFISPLMWQITCTADNSEIIPGF